MRSDRFGSSIPGRFAAAAAANPGGLAIDDAGDRLTYAQLDQLAADYRRACGSGTRGIVALLLPHGSSVLAAALGVLRAGHAVITVNPSDPPSAIAQLRERAAPVLVISDAAHADRARQAGFAEAQMVLGPVRGVQSPAGPAPAPEDLAFLIRTSGSSGTPKLVMQTHANMLSNVERYRSGLQVRGDDRVAWLAALSGGQGLATAWTTLLTGGTLCPFRISDRGFTGLADWLEGEQITVLDALPSVLRSFVRTLAADRRIGGVRLVRLASEPAQHSDFEAYRRHFSAPTLASVLGSSETGILAQALISREAEPPAGRLPVGCVASGVEVRLLDPDHAAVSDGEVGEIVVRGENLSPGYWGDEELTERRFGMLDGQRCFYTGDLARLSADGSLTVIGRADSQVKIRGHRLQLEEVDAALMLQPGVSAAGTVVRRTAAGDAHLIAYVSPRPGERLVASRLRRALRATLPPHAVPAVFVEMDGLPLTATGKVDREELARHEMAPTPAVGVDASASERERLVAAIWADAFERDAIPVDEAFLDLGGDSLTAAMIAAGVHDQLGLELDLSAFDRDLTVARMAAMATDDTTRPVSPRVPVTPVSEAEIGPLSHAQASMWRVAAEKGTGFNVSTAFKIDGPLNVPALRSALEQMIGRHDILRTSFADRNGEPVAEIHEPRSLDLALDDVRGVDEPEHAANQLLLADLARPFELAEPPLFRLRLVRLATARHWLVRTVHHIISDPTSWHIFFYELGQLYEARRRGQPSPLSVRPPLQFHDYVAWERTRLRPGTAEFEAELAWWQPRLEPSPPRVVLASERAAPIAAPDTVNVVDHRLAKVTASKLDALARENGATHFVSRLALFSALAAIDAQVDDLAIDTYVSMRTQPELHAMLGPLINRSVLRLRFYPDATLDEWIGAVRREVVAVAAHSWIPFEVLIDRMRGLGVSNPALGVKFQALGNSAPIRFGDGQLEPLPRHPPRPWGFTLLTGSSAHGDHWRAIFDPARHDPAGVGVFLTRLDALATLGTARPRVGLARLAREATAIVDAARFEREQILYERNRALGQMLGDLQRELDEAGIQVRLAHLALERARRSPAWRLGRRLSGSAGAEQLDGALSRLAALEQQSRD